jgi:AAA domain-containing protein
MALKAKKPEVKEKRLKLFLFGPPGSRKTTSALQFPKSVLIDMERGSEQYTKTIEKAGSIVLDTNNPEEVVAEVRSLLTEKHSYRTLILDPMTIYYEGVQEKWSRTFERYAKTDKEKELQDFGMRYWGRVKGEYKGFLRMLKQLDMNIIVTSHQKDIYGPNMQKVGIGPESMKGDNYFFDYVFSLNVVGGKAIAHTEKQRCEPLEPPKFPEDFEWSYANFLKFYGREIIEREAVEVPLASPEQVAEITRLLDIVKVNEEDVTKLFTKHDVDAWDELTAEAIQKYIDTLKKKIAPVSEKAVA